MSAFMREFTKAAHEGPRLFFAPIVGAVEAVRNELTRLTVTAEGRRPRSVRIGAGKRAKR